MASLAFSSALALPGRRLPAQGDNVGVSPRRVRLPRSPQAVRPARLVMGTTTPTSFKDALLEKIRPLDFGRVIVDSKEQQEEIDALARQLEASYKSTSPLADPNLSGTWDMVYTTSESVLGTSRPQFLQSSRIVQKLDIPNLRARNEETAALGPLRLKFAVEAELTPVSDFRVDVNFLQFVILGFIKVDVEKNDRFRGWLEVTYLDEDMRISRGNEGNLFVLVKE